MSIKRHKIEVSGMPVEVVRKNIKNLHLAVYPPDGSIRVAVPLHIDDEAVRLAVISRLAWVRRRRAGFEQQERQSRREFLRGESHFFQGRRYLLNLIYHDGAPRIVPRNRTWIDFYVRREATAFQRERAFAAWYRSQLREQIPGLVEKWSRVMDCPAPAWTIKHMKTRWGTCDTDKRHILLNLELAKKPVKCLEYIIVHEMVHLTERLHNERFTNLMDHFLPQWRLYRDELNSYPLRHENWEY